MAKHYFQASSGFVIETTTPHLWINSEGFTKLSASKGKAAHVAFAKARLLEILRPGDTVYTVLRSASASGMSRRIDVYAIEANRPVYLSGYAAAALDWRLDDSNCKRGITVNGGGMDMGFHLVWTLGQALWPDGTDKPHGVRNGEPDSVGGYALKHAWI